MLGAVFAALLSSATWAADCPWGNGTWWCYDGDATKMKNLPAEYGITGDKSKSLFPSGNDGTTGNRVTVNYVYKDDSSDNVPNTVFGGLGELGLSSNVQSNTVEIMGRARVVTVYGGFTNEGAANTNLVSIFDNAQITGTVYGGFTNKGAASANLVSIFDNAKIAGTVYGGFTANGAANANLVRIFDNAQITGTVYGGRGTTLAYGNMVDISGVTGTISTVYGGQGTTQANQNTVKITNDKGTPIKIGNVFGGYVSINNIAGQADENTVEISGNFNITSTGGCGGHVGSVFGGCFQDGGQSGLSNHADNNAVFLFGDDTATASVSGAIYGGWSHSYSGTLAQSSGNSVNITGVTVNNNNNVYGGYGWSTHTPYADNNTLNITGDSTITGNVYGGYVSRNNVSGNVGVVTGNTVNIVGSTVGGSVYGGYADHNLNTITSNTVSLSDGAIITGNVYGGYGGNTVFTGNTLNIKGTGNSAAGIYTFEFLDFTLPGSMTNEALLTVGVNGLHYGNGTTQQTKLNLRTPGSYVLGTNNNLDGRYTLLSNSAAQSFTSIAAYTLYDKAFTPDTSKINVNTTKLSLLLGDGTGETTPSSRVRGEFALTLEDNSTTSVAKADMVLNVASYFAGNTTVTWTGNSTNPTVWSNFSTDIDKSPENWIGKVLYKGDSIATDIYQYLDGDKVVFDGSSDSGKRSVAVEEKHGVNPGSLVFVNDVDVEYAFKGGRIAVDRTAAWASDNELGRTVKKGAGTMTLVLNNAGGTDFGNSLTVEAGKLVITGAGRLGTHPTIQWRYDGLIGINDTAELIFSQSAAQRLTGGISGQGTLSVTSENVSHDVSLTVDGNAVADKKAIALTGADGTVNVTSGATNAASLTVTGKLAAPKINLTKNTGALTADVETLDVTTANVALNLNATLAGTQGGMTGVFFENIDLGDGRTLNVTRDATKGGAYDFSTLNVAGQAAYSDLTNNAVTEANVLALAGKTVNFSEVPTRAELGTDALLTVTRGGVTLDAATAVNVTTSGRPGYVFWIAADANAYDGAGWNVLTLIHTAGGNATYDKITGALPNIWLNGAVVGSTSLDDFIGASAYITDEATKLVVSDGLAWYRPTQAHGTFNVPMGKYTGDKFTLGTKLVNNTTSTSLMSNWTGKTQGTELLKTGQGTLILIAANEYSGGTTIEEGKIVAGHNSALGTGMVTMKGGTTLGFLGDKNYTVENAFALENGGDVTFDTGTYNATLSGVISGTGSLTKIGTGQLILSSDENIYSGLTTISAGLLKVTGLLGYGQINGHAGKFAITATDPDTGLLFNQSVDQILNGEISGSGLLTQAGKTSTTTLSIAYDNLKDNFSGKLVPVSGVLKITHDNNLLFNKAVGVGGANGILAFELGDKGNELTFGDKDKVGDIFTGTVDLREGWIDLNEEVDLGGGDESNPNLVVLNNGSATLQLSADGKATTDGSEIYALAFNNGVLELPKVLADKNDNDIHILTVNTLDVTVGGAIWVDLSSANIPDPIDPTDPDTQFFDATTFQKYLIKADKIKGHQPGQQPLILRDKDGSPVPADLGEDFLIGDADDPDGMATYNYNAVVSVGLDPPGVYLGYGLTQIESFVTKTVAIVSPKFDSSDPGHKPALDAKLTGDGNFEFKPGSYTPLDTPTLDVLVGHRKGDEYNDYTGSTTVDSLSEAWFTLTAVTDKVFGNTSELKLMNKARVDFQGYSQIVGRLTGAAGTSVNLGSGSTLTVGGTVGSTTYDGEGTFAGSLTGTGTLRKEGAGKLVLNNENNIAGLVEVRNGKLIVGGQADENSNAKLTAEVNVSGSAEAEAILGGHGTLVGEVNIGNFGVLSPGNSIGTVMVQGDLYFDKNKVVQEGNPGEIVSNSVFRIELDPDTKETDPDTYHGDRVVVENGTAYLNGATVDHVRLEDGAQTSDPAVWSGKKWIILQADEIVGEFNSEVKTFVESIKPQFHLAKKDGNDSKDTLYLCFFVCFKEEEDLGGPRGPGGPGRPSLMLVNFGADFVIDRGLRPGRNLFAVVGGGKSRYRTGGKSRLDLAGTAVVAGASATRETRAGELTAGAFFEHGTGRYDARKVRGKGDARYTGGGVFALLEFEGTKEGNFYAEASARRGKLDVGFKTAEASGERVPDTFRAGYESAHVGVGYALKVDEYSVLKPYAQYLWSRQGSGRTARQEVELDAIDSRRTRVGAIWERHVGENRFRAGAAWEREFDGESGSSSSSPSLKGNTGRIDLGVTLKPAKSVTVDVDLQGHFGKREGVTGSVKLEYRF